MRLKHNCARKHEFMWKVSVAKNLDTSNNFFFKIKRKWYIYAIFSVILGTNIYRAKLA